MRNPTRRNRNIGTENQGFGQNNKMKIATRHGELKSFYERIENYQKESRIINGHEFLFITEQTRENSVHPCSINDIEKLIQNISAEDYGELKFIVRRQPKRKEEIISPVWGRLIYSYEFENNYYPAIILDAIDLTKKFKWTKKQSIEDQKEFERLKNDGHIFEENKREFITEFTFEKSRNTQLYRTLIHEFGHYVHYLNSTIVSDEESYDEKERLEEIYFSLSKSDKEKFAHKYADELKIKLETQKIIPFEPK